VQQRGALRKRGSGVRARCRDARVYVRAVNVMQAQQRCAIYALRAENATCARTVKAPATHCLLPTNDRYSHAAARRCALVLVVAAYAAPRRRLKREALMRARSKTQCAARGKMPRVLAKRVKGMLISSDVEFRRRRPYLSQRLPRQPPPSTVLRESVARV